MHGNLSQTFRLKYLFLYIEIEILSVHIGASCEMFFTLSESRRFFENFDQTKL